MATRMSHALSTIECALGPGTTLLLGHLSLLGLFRFFLVDLLPLSRHLGRVVGRYLDFLLVLLRVRLFLR